jgi:hypothetical protein
MEASFLDDTDAIELYFKALFDLSAIFSTERRSNFIKDLLGHGWSMKDVIYFEDKASKRTNYSSNAFVERRARAEGNGAFMNPTAIILG